MELGIHSNQKAVQGTQLVVEQGKGTQLVVEWGTHVQLAEGKRLWVEPGNRGKGVVEAGTPQWGRRGFVGEEDSRVGWLEVGGVADTGWEVEDDGPVNRS